MELIYKEWRNLRSYDCIELSEFRRLMAWEDADGEELLIVSADAPASEDTAGEYVSIVKIRDDAYDVSYPFKDESVGSLRDALRLADSILHY